MMKKNKEREAAIVQSEIGQLGLMQENGIVQSPNIILLQRTL